MAKSSAPPKKPLKAPLGKAIAKPKARPPVLTKTPVKKAAPITKNPPTPKPKPLPQPPAAHTHPTRESSSQVDPLLAGGPPNMKLASGHDRDAQLPTTLVPKPLLPAAVPLTVHAQAVPGAAHHGNSQPANILVLVSCGGWPVVDLSEDHFSIMEHFEVPGQTAPFSNNIVSFRNNGSGAYLIQVRPIGGAHWVSGQYLAQILVSSPDERHGQTAAKLIVR
jgi:hypothetical protein